MTDRSAPPVTLDQARRRITDGESLLREHEAASHCGVARVTIQQWVQRGHLAPVVGTRPRLFLSGDLDRCQTKRRPQKQQLRVRALASDFDA